MRKTIVLALAAVLAEPMAKDVPKVPLSDLVRRSSVVVVGKVDRVETVAGVRVAQVTSQDVVKGESVPATFAFVAEGTWACDVSTATEGETALLFLQDPVPSTGTSKLAGLWPALGTRKGFIISLSGRGRMPVHEGSRDRHVHSLEYFDEVATWPDTCKECRGREKPLADLLGQLRSIVDEQRPPR